MREKRKPFSVQGTDSENKTVFRDLPTRKTWHVGAKDRMVYLAHERACREAQAETEVLQSWLRNLLQ
jgi:hypothetical protein